jgi:hypothetical protein
MPTQAQNLGGRKLYAFTLPVSSALAGVGSQHHASAALPLRKNRYPLYGRLGGPRGEYGRVQKFSSLPGFNTRTVQSVTSRYTDYAIPAAK